MQHCSTWFKWTYLKNDIFRTTVRGHVVFAVRTGSWPAPKMVKLETPATVFVTFCNEHLRRYFWAPQVKFTSFARKYLDLWYGIAVSLVFITANSRSFIFRETLCQNYHLCIRWAAWLLQMFFGITLMIASFMCQLFIGLRIVPIIGIVLAKIMSFREYFPNSHWWKFDQYLWV